MNKFCTNDFALINYPNGIKWDNLCGPTFNSQYLIALPLQVHPSSEYPGLHSQLCDPFVLFQTGTGLQLGSSEALSLISKTT